MIRMEIALILVLAFVAYIYFSAGRRHTLLHKTFSVLLVTALVHLVFDALTVYTVARLDSVPRPVNDVLHRLFIGSMVLVVYLFYQYIAVLIEEETGEKPVLLLDDVLSELDNQRQSFLINSLGENQMFITTADISGKVVKAMPAGKIFRISAGEVEMEI